MQKQKKISKPGRRFFNNSEYKGFSLIELLLVMAVIVILFAAVMSSMANSRYTTAFLTAEEKVSAFLRQARTYAITGRAVTDTTDFDGDTLINDQVTPVGYGVTSAGNGKLLLFADMHGSVEKKFDDPTTGGKDLILDQYQMDKNLVELTEVANGQKVPNNDQISSVIYTPIFADVIFDGSLPAGQPYLNIEIYSKVISGMKRCFLIHPISGNPEPLQSPSNTDCPTL